MFQVPMSSPQMTRMFGFFVVAAGALAADAGFGACARAPGAASAAARSRERETGLRRVKGASFGVVGGSFFRKGEVEKRRDRA
jgi:hypothetical protein